MKLLIVLACVALSVQAGYQARHEDGEHKCADDLSNLTPEEIEDLYEDLMRDMGEEEEYNQETKGNGTDKEAKRQETENERKELLKQALKDKEAMDNDSNCTHSMSINRYTIMTDSELASRNGAVVPENIEKERAEGEAHHNRLHARGTPPKRVNHCRKTGPVEDQSGCGSCWAFAASHTMSGRVRVRDGKGSPIVRLSEQQAVDCKEGGGCNGGWMTQAWQTYHSHGGSTDFKYPYAGVDESGNDCTDPPGRVGLNIKSVSGYVPFSEDGGQEMKLAVAKGPVAVGFMVDSDFQRYGKGLYRGTPKCQSSGINHGMTVCGYDRDASTGKEYWMVKNSYGKDWGEKGYARVEMGKNVCHIEEYAMYPIMDSTKTDTSALCKNKTKCSSDSQCNNIKGACRRGKCRCQTCHSNAVCQTNRDCGKGKCVLGGQNGGRFVRQVSNNRKYCKC